MREVSPYISRITSIWMNMRDEIIAQFPSSSAPTLSETAYLTEVRNVYSNDAFNSLLIEGYNVSRSLLEVVKQEKFEIRGDESNLRDIMAARGYFIAREKVIYSIRRVFRGENAGSVADTDHQDWFYGFLARVLNCRF